MPDLNHESLPKDFVSMKPNFDALKPKEPVIEKLILEPQGVAKRDYAELWDQQQAIADDARAVENNLEIQALESEPTSSEIDIKLEPEISKVPNHSKSIAKSTAPKSFWYRVFKELLLETLLPAWLIVTFLIIPVGVRGESMNPTLESGDFLLVAKLERWLAAWGLRPNYLHNGDVIVLKPPSEGEYSFEPVSRMVENLPFVGDYANRLPDDWEFRPYFVKRIIGMPGDMVELRAGVVFVNGQKTHEMYINTPAAIEDSPATFVKPGTLFVMGDNRHRGSSLDSRVFGLVHLKDVAGRAVLRLNHSSQGCSGVFACLFSGWHLGGL